MARSSTIPADSDSGISLTENAPVKPLPATYEAALHELEGLIAQLESGQQPLEALLENYQRGAQLLAFCRSRLEAVENQIKVFDGKMLKPWSAA